MTTPDADIVKVRLIADDTPPKPFPVREVEPTYGRVRFDGTADSANNRQTRQLLSKVARRMRVVISVTTDAAALVYLGKSLSQVQDGSCLHLANGATIELQNTAEVWVAMAGGTTGVVSYVSEVKGSPS